MAVMDIDGLNEAILEVEDAIFDRKFNVTATVPLLGNGLSGQESLSWRRSGPDWGLTVVSKEGERTPLLKASVLHRVAAAVALPSLLDALLEGQKTRAAEVASATEAMKAFAARVRGTEVPGHGA